MIGPISQPQSAKDPGFLQQWKTVGGSSSMLARLAGHLFTCSLKIAQFGIEDVTFSHFCHYHHVAKEGQA